MGQAVVYSVDVLLLLRVLMTIYHFLRLSLLQRVVILLSPLELIFLYLFLLIIRRRVASPFILRWHLGFILFLLERLVRLSW